MKKARIAPPLDEAGLNELALAYVARYATSRAKLLAYLARKLRERGWGGLIWMLSLTGWSNCAI